MPLAHGRAPGEGGGPNWISALASPAYSDVVISGSCDGWLRFWHADEVERALKPLLAIPLAGHVNGLAIAPSSKFLCAAVGQEHRLGRWFRERAARNALAVVPLPACLHAKPRLLPSAARRGMRTRRAGEEEDGEGGEEEDEEDEEDGR